MSILEIPKEIFPVLRRWREDRVGLSYLVGSHVILLQEDLPLAETVFVLYHEAVHSHLFNCALGFLLGTLHGFQKQIAYNAMSLFNQELGESYLRKWPLRQGFYSRQPTRPGELPKFSPDADFLNLCRDNRFQQLVRYFLELRRRINILVNEWRFPHEALATLMEISACRDMKRIKEDCNLWATAFQLDTDTPGLDDSLIQRLSMYLKILSQKATEITSPEQLIATRGEGIDPYFNGSSFLFHHLLSKPDSLGVYKAVQIASQIPYGMLPGLDEPFSLFTAVAHDACSPTVRLARLALAAKAGLLDGKSGKDCLPYAISDDDVDAATAVSAQGYYGWEWQALHCSTIVQTFRPVTDESQHLPYGLTDDQFLYNREPMASGGKVWVIYNDRAVLCNLNYQFGLTPVTHTESECKSLMKLLKSNLVYQGFERLAENIVAAGVVLGDDGTALEWV